MVLLENLSYDARKNVAGRPTLEKISYEGNIGRARMSELYRMFYVSGPGNGTMLSLPFDQLVEHGVGHCLAWERSADARAVIELGNRGNFSALALSIGQAEKYQNLIRPDLPLLVKVDGHFLAGKDIPHYRHATMSSVERAVEAGANAIGFTFYLGGEETEEDIERVAKIVEEAHRYGKPVFMWAYTRGPLPDKMGADSLYWCAQGISAAESFGVDVVKQKFPMPAKNIEAYKQNLGKFMDKKEDVYSKLDKISEKKGYLYSKMPDVSKLLELEPQNPKDVSYELHVKRLAFMSAVAPNLLKIISGGPKAENPEKELIETTRAVMDSGCEGRIVGRNFWARPIKEALSLVERVVGIMRQPEYSRILTEPRFTGKY